MSNNNLDSVETALRQLKDIVDRNHSQGVETGLIVQQMERLVIEMKGKTREVTPSPFVTDTTMMGVVPGLV